ncbi:MAG TPA: divalent-cation tolerance protein CutA [Gammaproteobacteria bacterium]|nr:divalent-cation tolerance protein CutA [Gammaproteobacteria bacterium]
MGDRIMVLTTYPDQSGAEQLARELVEKKLAACVNILPPMTSVYRWRGNVESGREHQLVIKTRQHLFSRVEQLVAERHPYELPELLVLPVQGGSRNYLAWIDEVTDD